MTVKVKVKERTGNTTWCECCKCKAEKREIDCLCCQVVAALNEKFGKLAVLYNVLTGLHDSRGDYLEKITSNRSYRYAAYKQFTW